MTALAMIAFGELSAGRWDEAQQFAAESTALCEERGYRLMAWTGRYATALIAGNRGDRQACQEICQAMIEWAIPRRLGHLHEFAHHAVAQAALGAGDFEVAYAHATAISPPGTLGSHTTQALWVAPDVIDAAVHSGRHSEAQAHAEAMRRADLGAPLRPASRSHHGSSDGDGRLRRRSTGFVRSGTCASGDRGVAVRAGASGDCGTANGCVGFAAYVMLGARGSSRQAARDGFERLGARPWSRTSGGRDRCHRRHPCQRVTGGGAVSLTLQEREHPPLLAATA